jgi:hypothetical protein
VGLLGDVSRTGEDELDTLTGNGLLKNLALGCLGVAKVHHLVHELVDDDKIVADALLLEFLEVLDEDLGEAVKKEDGLCGIGIAL